RATSGSATTGWLAGASGHTPRRRRANKSAPQPQSGLSAVVAAGVDSFTPAPRAGRKPRRAVAFVIAPTIFSGRERATNDANLSPRPPAHIDKGDQRHAQLLPPRTLKSHRSFQQHAFAGR